MQAGNVVAEYAVSRPNRRREGMNKLMRSCMAFAGLACLADPSPVMAQEGPGKGYAQVTQGAYSVVAEVRAKPGKEAELRAVTLPLIALVRGNPKNLVYFLQEDRESPGHFVFYEVFANQADFDAHNAMPYVKDWFTKLPELADGGVKVMRMEILAKPR
jgi:quinol monooxygenase YgiN